MSDQAQHADLEMVRKHVGQLGDHFDTVHIFCTRQEASAGGTVNVQLGCGNWFARYGQIASWLVKEDEASRLQVLTRESEE